MDPYAIRMSIPISLWQTTTDTDTVNERARKRAVLRRLARTEWRNAKRQGAKRVGRFMLLALIAGRKEAPMLACETLKPIIDAGTDERLWPDDDPFHRVLTGYMRDPTPAPANRPRITIMIIPLGRTVKPPACILNLLNQPQGAVIHAAIPDREWLTSNMRHPPKERQRRQTMIMRRVASQWKHVTINTECVALCAVRYPDNRDEYQGDPDNTAETATAIWGAGVISQRVPREPSVFMFYLQSGQSEPRSHDMNLMVIPTGPGLKWATLLTNMGTQGTMV